MNPEIPRATSPGGKAELLAFLADDPGRATPALALDLWQRVVELHRSDARAARELAECAWLVAERAGDQRSRALAHRALALAALATGHQREVLSHYEAAERLHRELGEEVERARVLRSMIDPLMHLGRYEEALATGQAAGAILRERGESVLAGQVEANLGNVHHRLGRDAQSLDAYDRALAAFRAAGDRDAAAVVEFNRANVFAERGDLAEADRGYRRALRHYRERGEGLRESQVRYQLAYLAFLAGRYSEALRGIEEVRRMERALGDERHAALCTLDEAELLLSLNAWEEARERAAEARGELEALGLAQDAIRATLFLGLGALQLRRWDEAASRLGEARAGFEGEGHTVLAALAVLYQAELALRRGDARHAFRGARRAVAAFEAHGLAAKEAYARVVAGRALAALGRRSRAARQADLALDLLQRVPSVGTAWRAHALRAELADGPGERGRRLETAIAEAEKLRGRILPDELQAAFQRDKVDLYEALALVHLEETADPAAAFEVLESARARVLGDRLENEVSADGGTDRPEGGGALRSAVETLNALYRRLNESEREGGARTVAEPIRAAIARRESELAAVHRSAQLSRRAMPAGVPERSSLDGVRAILAPDEAVVAYAFLRSALHAFVIDRSGIAWTDAIASRSEVQEALGRWLFQAGKTALGPAYLEAHAGALRATAAGALGRLYDLAWEPIRARVEGAQAVTVVPSGPLFYLPFHALWDGRHYLVELHEVATSPSARAMIALDGRGDRRPLDRTRALIMGYAVPGLPGIAREVDAVADRLPGATVLVGPAATREALRRRGAEASIVHLAAHADFRDDNPLLSAIELADGRLTFYDLFDLRLEADLVVLSGCQTGRSRVLEGDELMGLARGFQYAGARALVGSLWPVEDAAAAALMDRFYAEMAAGRGPRGALTAAMRARLAVGRLPHEWAPFYLSGRTTEEVPSP